MQAYRHLFQPFQTHHKQKLLMTVLREQTNLIKDLRQKNVFGLWPLHTRWERKSVLGHWKNRVDADGRNHKICNPFGRILHFLSTLDEKSSE